ncbi:mitochondrial ribosomal protein S34 [Calliopsis andreniformis]|uniref:mitochondrial ribosomal protein S34 n=1 Tax=Calliopsis andreniformis TaxID=337506 RepID=UPI003FCDD125
MVIKYIGRTTTYKGKPLWEILGNLKNFGVGRMVIRSQHERYSEPCYMKILKVAALPNTSKNLHDPRKVMVLVQKIFRGKTIETPVQIDSASYKADYVLIPKDQEAQYLNATGRPSCKIMPRTVELPPLLKELVIRQAKQAGKSIEEPKLEMRYNFSGIKNYRIAKEGEMPTVDIKLTNCTKLYMNDTQKNTS